MSNNEKWFSGIVSKTRKLMGERVPKCTASVLREELLEILPRETKMSIQAVRRYLTTDQRYAMRPNYDIGVAFKIWNNEQKELLK